MNKTGKRFRILKRNGMWRIDEYEYDPMVDRPFFRKSHWYDTWAEAVDYVWVRQWQLRRECG